MTWYSNWINLIVGILLIASPFVLGFTADVTAMWTAIVGGVVVAIVSLLAVVFPSRVGAAA